MINCNYRCLSITNSFDFVEIFKNIYPQADRLTFLMFAIPLPYFLFSCRELWSLDFEGKSAVYLSLAWRIGIVFYIQLIFYSNEHKACKCSKRICCILFVFLLLFHFQYSYYLHVSLLLFFYSIRRTLFQHRLTDAHNIVDRPHFINM